MTKPRGVLDSLCRPAELVEPVEGDTVRCLACAHGCVLAEGARGACLVRHNEAGVLMAPFGYVHGLACDPVEKKPFYHVMPGSDVISFGMLGCNFHCPFCQNWQCSQVLRDPLAAATHPDRCSPEDIVKTAVRRGAPLIASTYNEPLITADWALAIFRQAHAQSIRTCMVSNGFAGEQVLDALQPVLDAMNVDLKCFTEDGYRRLGGRLEPVKRTIRSLHRRGIWVEVVTLVVPGFNDDDHELRAMAEFVASVGVEVPWHISAYRAMYKYGQRGDATSPERIARALELGREAGLRYVYPGNLPTAAQDQNTACHACGATLVQRSGFHAVRNNVRNGACPDCGTPVAGVW